jgi:hypothetical protein
MSKSSLFTRSLLPILTGVTGLTFGACSESSTGPEELGVVFPLQVGNTWTYEAENPQLADPLHWEVTGRHADTVILSRPQGDAYTGPLTLVDSQDEIEIVLGQMAPQPLYRFKPGASWIRHDPWECDDGSEWTAVREDESIETPAGTFHNTIRLERRSTATCADAGTMFEWWAPGVGLVRWEELNFWNEGTLAFELASFGGPLL